MASIDSFPANANNNPNSKRRRFQAPITSFFTSSNSSDPSACASPTSSNNNHHESPTFPPVLPHKVQSSLLTVGMRIRKSVPEGYKTPTSSSSMMKSYPPQNQTEDHTSGGTYTELTPFCGIMKTGNLSVQTFPRTHMDNIQPSSSSRRQQLFDQEGTVFSTGLEEVAEAVLPPSTKKRGFEMEEDGGGSDEETDMTLDFPPSSSQSSVPSLIPSSSQSSTVSSMSTFSSTPRQILQPKFGGQKKVRFGMTKHSDGEGQENVMCPVVVDDGDFEEASFLVRKEDLEMDVEVG